jgi:tetratricopeptide (TPR) repeat protein
MHGVRIRAAQRQGREAEAAEHLSLGTASAARLAKFDRVWFARRVLVGFYFDFGARDDSIDALLALMKHRPTSWVPVNFAAGMYRYGEEENALQILNETKDVSNELHTLAECYLLATSGAEHGLLKRVDGIMSRFPDENHLFCGLCIWLLSGNLENARSRAARLLETHDDLGPSFKTMLQFIAGQIDKRKLRKSYEPEVWLSPDADYCIGLVALAQGNLDDAKECFEKVVGKDNTVPPEYKWSKAFLERMNEPSWPAWITRSDSLNEKSGGSARTDTTDPVSADQ